MVESVVIKWYARANEASFKAVAGGYVFQAPNPWIFARPRYYLVSEAKKAEIGEVMGRWRRLFLLLMATIFPIGLVTTAFLPALFKLLPGIAGPGFLVVFIPLIAVVYSIPVLVPQVYLTRALRSLLADAPRTDERIKIRDQLAIGATSVSGKLLAVGLTAGLVAMAAGLLILLIVLYAYLEGRIGSSLLVAPALISLVSGALVTAYFVYLVRLRAKLKRLSREDNSVALPVHPS